MSKSIFVLIASLFCFHGFAQDPADDNKVYVAVEVQAVPSGGLKQFYSDFLKEFKAPELEKGVNMVRLMISFVVERDGSLTDLKVLRDGGIPKAAQDAIRVLKKLPRWEPATQNNATVRSQFTLPITIQIAEDKKPN